MEERRLTEEQKDALAGGAMSFMGNMGLMGMMMLPSLILSLVSAGLSVAAAVEGTPSQEPKRVTGADISSIAPRPYVRLSPVVSRSTVAYGLPF